MTVGVLADVAVAPVPLWQISSRSLLKGMDIQNLYLEVKKKCVMLDRDGKQIPMIEIMKRPEVLLSESGKKEKQRLRIRNYLSR